MNEPMDEWFNGDTDGSIHNAWSELSGALLTFPPQIQPAYRSTVGF